MFTNGFQGYLRVRKVRLLKYKIVSAVSVPFCPHKWILLRFHIAIEKGAHSVQIVRAAQCEKKEYRCY